MHTSLNGPPDPRLGWVRKVVSLTVGERTNIYLVFNTHSWELFVKWYWGVFVKFKDLKKM